MTTRKGLTIAERIEDEFRFIRTWATSPKKMGAVSPTSRALARLMVKHAAPDPAGMTLELGPGTGVVTEALLEAGIPRRAHRQRRIRPRLQHPAAPPLSPASTSSTATP